MNSKKAKQLRKKSRELCISWIKSLLPNEDKPKVTLETYKSLMPDENEKYIYANNRLMLSAYTERWFYKNLKNILKKNKNKTLNNISLKDFEQQEINMNFNT